MSPRPEEPSAPEFEVPLRLAREGMRAEAIAWIEHAHRGRSQDERFANGAAETLKRVAGLAEADGDWPGAQRALDAALDIRPRFADLHFQRARALLAQTRRGDARKALDAALALNPRYVAARVERALLDAREGLIGEALEALRALARDARVEEPRAFERGLASLEEADWREAGGHLARALKLEDPVLEKKIAGFRESIADDPAGAARLIREALEAHPGYPDLHYLLGSAELRRGHADDAVESLSRALELHPDFHAARIQLARALMTLGSGEQACELLGQVLELEPAHAEASELLARWTPRSRAAPAAVKAAERKARGHHRSDDRWSG